MDELLERWRQLYDAKKLATKEIVLELEALSIKVMNIAKPFDEGLRELETEIRDQAMVLGKTYRGNGVEVKYRSGYTHMAWDNARLEGFAAVYPEIMQFRSGTTVQPSVTIVRAKDV